MSYTRAELKMMNTHYKDEIIDAFADKMIKNILTSAQKTSVTSVRFVIHDGACEGLSGLLLTVVHPYKVLHTVKDFQDDTLYDACKERLELRLTEAFYDSKITVIETTRPGIGRVVEFTVDWT